LITLLASPLAALARQATPQPGAPTARPHCAEPPVSPAALAAMLREPVADDPAAENPAGAALPPAERAPLGDLVGRWSRCLASGDMPALLGLFTPDGIRRLLADPSPLLGGPAGLRVSIRGVSDVVRMADGRITGRVTVDPSGNGSAPPLALVILIEEIGGKWRIDALHLADERDDAPPAARPLLRRPVAPGPDAPIHAPGPSVAMRGGDPARSGAPPGPAPGTAPEEMWRAPAGWQSTAQPVVARGLVLYGGYSLGERRALLEAVDAASGRVRWQSTAPAAQAEFADSPALAGDALFAPVQAPVAGMLALLIETGEPLWYAPFGVTSVTAPVLDAERVYVAGWGPHNRWDSQRNVASGAVISLDLRTGRERWRFLAPARFGALAVGGNGVYVPSDHGLYALDRTTGQKRWQARFSPAIGEPPTVAGSLVVFAGIEITSGKPGVFALDAATGALHWRIDLPAVTGARAGVATDGNGVYVTWWQAPGDQPGPTLRAYDLESGKERWVYRAAPDSDGAEIAGGSITEPVIVDGLALFGVAIPATATKTGGALDGLYAVDLATGALTWHAASSVPIGSAPAVLGGTIYAMGGSRPGSEEASGNLLAFSAQ
jgi:outer membrane protein assembly factor BamB